MLPSQMNGSGIRSSHGDSSRVGENMPRRPREGQPPDSCPSRVAHGRKGTCSSLRPGFRPSTHRAGVAAVLPLLSLVFLEVSSTPPSFSLGSCGEFEDSPELAVVDVMVKVAFEQGIFDSVFPTTNFSVTVHQLHVTCGDTGLAPSVFPLLAGVGTEEGRVYNSSSSIDPVVAMAGCSCTTNTDMVARLAQSYFVPMVSGSETSNDLSNADVYSYFARTTLAESIYGTMLGNIVSQMGWTSAVVFYESTDDVSRSAANAFNKVASGVSVTRMSVSRSYTYTSDNGIEQTYATLEAVETAIDGLLEKTVEPAAIVNLVRDDILGLTLFCASENLGITQSYTTYLTTEDLCRLDNIFWTNETRHSPLVALAGLESCFAGATEAARRPNYEGLVCPRTKTVDARTEALSNFFSTITCSQLRDAGLPDSFPCSDTSFASPVDSLIGHEYWASLFDATTTILYAISSLLASGTDPAEIKGETLWNSIVSSSFDGLSGTVGFSSIGERDLPFVVSNLQYQEDGSFAFAEVGRYDTASAVFTSYGTVTFKGNSSVPPSRPECPAGEEWRSLGEGCSTCEAGTYPLVTGTSTTCTTCPGGSYRSLEMEACTTCEAGYYCPEGSAEPIVCGAGYHCVRASSEREACPVGKFASSNTSTLCVACPVGTYANTSATEECLLCPDHLTTVFTGAESASECVCPAGQFEQTAGGRYDATASADAQLDFDAEDVVCVACPESMLCQEPNTTEIAIQRYLSSQDSAFPFPTVVSGYMTLASDPLAPYKCKTSSWCPGGAPATCLDGRDENAVGCGKCRDGWFDGSHGHCTVCNEAQGKGLLIGSFILASIGLFCFAFLVSRQNLLQTRAVVTCLVVGGLSISSVQTLGLFTDLAVTWVSPLKEIMSGMRIFTLDLHELQVDCVVGVDSFSNYVLVIAIPVYAAAIILLSMAFKKFVFAMSLSWRSESINAVGSLFSLCYVSLVMVVARPFICYEHPGDQGYSMVSSPAILCYQSDEHTRRVIAGCSGFLALVVPFTALICWATFRHRGAMNDVARADKHLRMFRFLFSRYNSSSYYYGLIVLLRGFMFSAIPIATRFSIAAQVLTLVIAILAFSFVQQTTQPWRSLAANRMESIVLAFLVALLTCAAMGTEFESGADVVVGVLGGILFCFVVLAILVSFAIGLRQWLVPPLLYRWFISHHKRAAAAQARYIQHLLTHKTSKSCFIDSDHLVSLDTLFDIVRCNVGELVVYLTSETLRRPWCAGEIAITWLTHKRALSIITPSFEPPNMEGMSVKQFPSFLDGSRTHLTMQGIGPAEIIASYEWLLSPAVTTLSVSHDLRGRAKFDHLALGILEHANLRRSRTSMASNGGNTGHWQSVSAKPEESYQGLVLFASDPSDDEATAAAAMLATRVQMHLTARGAKGILVLADMEPEELEEHKLAIIVQSSPMVIVVLSVNSLYSEVQLQVVEQAVTCEKTALIPVVTPSFTIPAEESCMQIITDAFGSTNGLTYAWAVKKLLTKIAIILSTHASIGVLDAQAAELMLRAPKELALNESFLKRGMANPQALSSSQQVSASRSRSTEVPRNTSLGGDGCPWKDSPDSTAMCDEPSTIGGRAGPVLTVAL